MHKRFLAQCETEALHLSGAIQPHGCLLVVNSAGTITHASNNISNYLHQQAQDWIGKPLPDKLLGLINELDSTEGSRIHYPGLSIDGADQLDVVCSRGASGEIVIEFTRCTSEDADSANTDNCSSDDEHPGITDQQKLLEELAKRSGFSRIMYYLFLDDDDGEVVAETHQADNYGSYLGLRFPASDIPRIARNLYLKNPWRMIPDAGAEPVPIIGSSSTPPELTWSDLRSVSPVHRVYLANMGVVASLSFPVVINGALVALVAAHHHQPRQISNQVLMTLSSLVRDHAHKLASAQAQSRIRFLDGLKYRFEFLLGSFRRHGDLFSAWPEIAPQLMQEFKSVGVVLLSDENSLETGVVLEPEPLWVVDDWFRKQDKPVWNSDSLNRHFTGFPLSAVAGVLALRLTDRRGRSLRLYLTRDEYIHEVSWAGNPDKPVEYHDGELGISPRANALIFHSLIAKMPTSSTLRKNRLQSCTYAHVL